MSRYCALLLCGLALASVVAMVAAQAVWAPTQPVDEALWFQRSLVSPATISGDGRFWAIDVPALNRWTWWLALKATGRDRIPAGEQPAFYLDETGQMRFQGRRCSRQWLANYGGNITAWMSAHGAYAPRLAILTMRMTNVGWYALMLVALWYAGYLALGRRPVLAAVAAMPLAVNPLFARNVGFMSQSGDIQFLALSAVMLAAWLRFHLAGTALAPTRIALVAILAGFAVSAKQTGVLPLAAYLAYLGVASRGWQRLAAPVAASVVAFIIFACLNPVIFLCPDETPSRVCAEMIARRGFVVRNHIGAYGPAGWTKLADDFLYWWPVLPAAGLLGWTMRRERWFAPVALWASVMIVGTLAGVFSARVGHAHYRAPLELAIWWPLALAMVAVYVRGAAGSKATTPQASSVTSSR